MTKTGMIDYHCLLPFNFEDPIYREIDDLVLDCGMGLDSEHLFKYALRIMFDMATIDDVLKYLDDVVFPEHVPNDSLSTCLNLCIVFINYVTSKLIGYKGYLNLMVRDLSHVSLDKYASTIHVNFNLN